MKGELSMPTYEGLRLKILKIKRKAFASQRKKAIKDTNFTIISNNCWGGMLYESYNLPKESPTVGLFIMASDYVKFVSNLKYYLGKPLVFLKPEYSKWKNQLSADKRWGTYPIGKIEDIEIFFLHYKSEKEAIDKWYRRIRRINWNRLLIKFDDQNGCTEQDLENFLNLPYKHKLFFTCRDWPKYKGNKSVITIKQPSFFNTIMASYEPFGQNKYIDLNKLINDL